MQDLKIKLSLSEPLPLSISTHNTLYYKDGIKISYRNFRYHDHFIFNANVMGL